MTPRAIWALGAGQLVNWGVLYYAFAVLLVPLEAALDAPRWAIAGAFSAGLLTSAAAAPGVGRLTDRGHGPALLQGGGLAAAGTLALWAAVPSLSSTVAAWCVLGVCMAAILYEPVFVIVGRGISESSARLRAIATVTVMGGLASTVFLPLTAALVTRWGWRIAVAALAAILASTTLVVGRVVFRDLTWSVDTIRAALADDSPRTTGAPLDGLNRLATLFAISSAVNSAFASNLVAALIDRQIPPTIAATIAGVFGLLQLPGRLLMTSPRFTPAPHPLLLASFGLQIAGLLTLTLDRQMAALWLGVMLFAGGAGLTTLARPYLVLHTYGADRAGVANGAIARAQQLARAGGPVSAALMASVTGYGKVFASLAALVAVAMTLTTWVRPIPHGR